MEISDEFGLTLFGFDVIIPTDSDHKASTGRDSDLSEDSDSTRSSSPASSSATEDCASHPQFSATPELLVIDINFFPSYKEVADFPARLRSFLRKSKQQIER
jgi:hypothetical protein